MSKFNFERLNKRNPKIEIEYYKKLILLGEITATEISSYINKAELAGLETLFWVLREVSRENTSFFYGLEEILYNIWVKYSESDMISRNFLGIFQEIEITNQVEDRVYERSFKLLNQSFQPIAVKAFSMTVCFRIAQKYPELLLELKIVIEDILHLYGQESPALNSRGKQILRKINQRLRKSYP